MTHQDPVNWENRYREGDTPWEKGAPAPPLRAWLSRNSVHGDVLVPGCGIGEDSRLLAAQGARVTGLDIAASAVNRARGIHPVASETYRLGDICDLPPDLHAAFDWVFEHTCFCAIHPSLREAYVRGVYAALRPGGRLLGLFYPRTGNPPGEGPPYPATPEELDEWFARGFSLLHRWIPEVGYPGRVHNEEFRILMKTGHR